jgi:hypothetical protein
MDLPHGDPACFNAHDVDFVEDQQHGGAGPHPEGRGPQGKGSPRGGREDPPSGSPASTSNPARLHPLGGECSGGCSLEVSVSPRLALRPNIFHRMSSLWGPPQIDLFASRQSAQTLRFMSWRAADNPEAIDALSMRWNFKLAFLFPPIPLLKRVMRKLELSRGTFIPVLGDPDLVRQSPGASGGGRPPSSLQQQPRHRPVNRGASSIPGAALPSRLEDLRGSWGVDAVSDRSFRLIAAGWKRSLEDRYERAWQSFKTFLLTSSIALHQASLKTVLDYLTHLYNRGLSWSSIGIHKSTIFMTMAPIDVAKIGDHPLVKRLMSGIFNERPSHRANPALLDPLKVLSVFQH